MIAEDWPKYATRPGRNETPLDELSFEAWIKQYKPSENYVNRAVSYYEKGLWAGMALDLELRARDRRAARPARDVPPHVGPLRRASGGRSTEQDVRDAAAAIAGRRMDRFFDRYVRGTDELPLPALWRRAGMKVAARAEWDESAKPPADRDRVRARRARAWTGIDLHPDRLLVRNVVPDSPAWRAGITFGDDIVAVDGVRVNPATFAKRVGDAAPGARLPHRLLPPRPAARGDADARREPGADLVGRRRREGAGPARRRCAPAGWAAGDDPRGARAARGGLTVAFIAFAALAACTAPAREARGPGRDRGPAATADALAPRARRPPARVHPRGLAAADPHRRRPAARGRRRKGAARPRRALAGLPAARRGSRRDRRRAGGRAAGGELARVDLRPLPPDPAAIREHGLLYLPRPYVVPGGRFNEMYGWDSYFIVVGLLRDGRVALARDVIDDFLYEVRHYGGVLNANRTYYLTRSQPPLLSQMVLALYRVTGERALLTDARAALVAVHEHWLAPPHLLPALGLSRYFDHGEGPRPRWWRASATRRATTTTIACAPGFAPTPTSAAGTTAPTPTR